MFRDSSRSLNTQWHPTLHFQYVEQNIYGSGPQTLPIVDPRLVLEYQKSHLPEHFFNRTIGHKSIANGNRSHSS